MRFSRILILEMRRNIAVEESDNETTKPCFGGGCLIWVVQLDHPNLQRKKLLENINGLIKKARSKSIPKYFMQQCSPRLVEDTVEWQLHPQLDVNSDDLFD